MWQVSKTVVTGVCMVTCLLGLPFCYNSGVFVFELFSWYSSWSLLLLALLEVVLVAWIFGAKRVLGNIREMGISLGMHGLLLFS